MTTTTTNLLRRILYQSNTDHCGCAEEMQQALELIHDLVSAHAPELDECCDIDSDDDVVETLEISHDTESWQLIDDVGGALQKFGLTVDCVSDDAAETLVYEIRRSH